MSIVPASSVGRVEVIRTDTFIDRLSGIGGIPKGKITEIWGDSGVGKSTLCLQAVAEAQKSSQRVLWADTEYYFAPRYAEALGVDTEALGLILTARAEDVLNTIEQEVSKGNVDLVVLDSIGGLSTRNEAEKEAGEKTIGAQAGIIAPFLRRIVPLLYQHKVALVVINHSFVDIMSGAIKTSGGKKLEYHRSLSIRLRNDGKHKIEQSGKRVGSVIIASVKRNKLAGNENMETQAKFLYDKGFMASLDLLDEALERGIITKTGNTHWYGEVKIGTISAAREWITQDENQENIRAALGA